jgi:hypothetical protein
MIGFGICNLQSGGDCQQWLIETKLKHVQHCWVSHWSLCLDSSLYEVLTIILFLCSMTFFIHVLHHLQIISTVDVIHMYVRSKL